MAKKKIAALVGEGFEDSELKVPRDRLTDAGFEVDLIGVEPGRELKGYRGQEVVHATRGIDQAKPEDYDALFIPGGHSPDKLRGDERFVSFVRRFDELDRPVAAVCHGPQLLMAARRVEGRTLTAWKTVRADLELIPKVTVKDEPVVRDRNWITSRKPEDLEAFSAAVIETLRA